MKEKKIEEVNETSNDVSIEKIIDEKFKKAIKDSLSTDSKFIKTLELANYSISCLIGDKKDNILQYGDLIKKLNEIINKIDFLKERINYCCSFSFNNFEQIKKLKKELDKIIKNQLSHEEIIGVNKKTDKIESKKIGREKLYFKKNKPKKVKIKNIKKKYK